MTDDPAARALDAAIKATDGIHAWQLAWQSGERAEEARRAILSLAVRAALAEFAAGQP